MHDCWVVFLPLLAMTTHHAEAQQTLAMFYIPSASLNMTAGSLSTAGLPSYSSLILRETGQMSLQVYECQAGYYSDADAQTCTACQMGKYSGSAVASSSSTCISCESGKYSGAFGAISSAACLDCPNGTYYEGVAGTSLSACLACPANSTSYPGSRLLQACVCWPGYERVGGVCQLTACGFSSSKTKYLGHRDRRTNMAHARRPTLGGYPRALRRQRPLRIL